MSNKTLDARGWACPKPVIETRKALQAETPLIVIVDNKAAKENVSRLATKLGFQIQVEDKSDGTYIHIERSESTPQEIFKQGKETYSTCENTNIVLVIASDAVGRGNDELGGVLMRAFMHTLLEVKPQPNMIIFINNGVKLTIRDSLLLEDLQELSDSGIEILVCGTCLNYFGLTDSLAVGIISNAYNIAEALLQANKVINL